MNSYLVFIFLINVSEKTSLFSCHHSAAIRLLQQRSFLINSLFPPVYIILQTTVYYHGVPSVAMSTMNLW